MAQEPQALDSLPDASPGQAQEFYVVEIPLRRRLVESLAILSLTVGACLLVWAVQSEVDQLDRYWWYVWPIAMLGGAATVFLLLRKNKRLLTNHGIALKQQRESMKLAESQAAQERIDSILQRWWVRYPSAVAVLGIAYRVLDDTKSEKDALIILAGAAFVIGLLTREITVPLLKALAAIAAVVVAFFVLNAIWKGVESLPVNLAIILGAIIIAAALRSK